MPKAKPASRTRGSSSRNTTANTARRSRTFDGCRTCRRRHVRCDQVRPECLTCEAVGVECEGYVADLRWMTSNHGPSDPVDASFARRHLYTEKVRERMSTSLTASLTVHGSVDACLGALESKANAQQQTNIGPFGVIRTVTARETSPPLPSPLSPPALPPPTLPGRGPEQGHASAAEVLPVVSTPVDSDRVGVPGDWQTIDVSPSYGLNDALQWDDLFELGPVNMSDPFYSMVDPLLDFDDPEIFQYGHKSVPNGQSHADVSTGAAGPLGSVERTGTVPSPTAVSTSPPAILSGDLLGLGPPLIRHFRDHVIPHISALPLRAKHPWSSIILPAGIDTYSQLTFMESIKVTKAKQAGLYSLLAMSAYHLYKNPGHRLSQTETPERWAELAQTLKQQATHCLKFALRNEVFGLSKAKYKDLLIATMSIGAFSIMTGAQKDSRSCMIDAERLMRVRGLAKREISRKCRLLHHMYTWTRIVGESTYVLHDYEALVGRIESNDGRRVSGAPQLPNAARPGRRHHTKLDDFLRIDVSYPDDEPDQRPAPDVTEPGGPAEVALKDIHLEDSHDNPDSMYGMIYGISETWLRLLSQTTRLANHMDAMRSTEAGNVPEFLLRQAARLEDLICSFAASSSTSAIAETTSPFSHMHTALNASLVIFFYRRIRNVNAWILQTHVDTVVRALLDLDLALRAQKIDYPGTVWPAFIAGCEAIAPATRASLLECIERVEARTGLWAYHGAKQVLMELWQLRSSSAASSSSASPTWMDVLRDGRFWLIAC